MNIARKIPDEPSKEIVDQAFDVLCGSKSFTLFSSQLPPDLKSVDVTAVNTNRWKDLETWVDWWKRLHVLKKLTKAYSALTEEDWDDLPGTTNPVESINRQSIPQNLTFICLKPLVEHIYLNDRRHATLQIATLPFHIKQKVREAVDLLNLLKRDQHCPLDMYQQGRNQLALV